MVIWHWLSGKVRSTCVAKLPSMSLLTALRFQQKWQMVSAGIQNICPARLLVARPQRPAGLHQPLLNCRSKYSALIGMACSCYSEGGILCYAFDVHHCVQSRRAILSALCFPFRQRFFYSGEWFLKWGRQKTDSHGLDGYARPGVRTVTEDGSKAVYWELHEHDEDKQGMPPLIDTENADRCICLDIF